MLDGVNVALGVTGSIAAVRCVELIHELRRRGASVRVVTTEAAGWIIQPDALEFASDAPVVESLTGAVEHIELCGRSGWADVFAIAPATANTIGKVATAIDDTPVTTCATTAIGSGIPLVLAPAMHKPMHDHPVVTEHLETVDERFGATVVPPRIEEGKAKLASDEAIALGIARAANEQPLAGTRIAVTSGATHEPLDPVRVISTLASGRTGRALARALYVRGASVDLIQADPAKFPYAEVHTAQTAGEMETAALGAVDAGVDAFVSAAAIGDFTVDARDDKIPSGEGLTIELRPTRKVIESVREAAPDLPIVGFKAETTDDDAALIAEARELQAAHDLAFVVANDASVMGAETTRVQLVDGDATDTVDGPKESVAGAIADRLVSVLT